MSQRQEKFHVIRLRNHNQYLSNFDGYPTIDLAFAKRFYTKWLAEDEAKRINKGHDPYGTTFDIVEIEMTETFVDLGVATTISP